MFAQYSFDLYTDDDILVSSQPRYLIHIAANLPN